MAYFIMQKYYKMSHEETPLYDWVYKDTTEEDNKREEERTCDIENCEMPEYPENSLMPFYGWCQKCEEFGICCKRDNQHDMALLYNEGCREHDSGGYSVCVPCALAAFKEKEPTAEEAHCICPKCGFDYGLLVDLEYRLIPK